MKTILIAEDVVELRELAATILRDSGYHVLLANSHMQAVKVAGLYEGTIDAMVLNGDLRTKGSQEAIEEICRQREEIKLLFVVGENGENHLLDREGIEFLVKPYKVEDLLSKIRGLLREDAVDPCEHIVG
ncbi:MAG: response regulator [Fimbriimonadales bacterium]